MDSVILQRITSSGFQVAVFVPILYAVVASLGLILDIWNTGDMQLDARRAKNLSADYETNFDFIIVGAGSAGCLLANRLSRKYTVLLLEAGGEPNPLQFIPGFSLFLINYPEVDWMHRSVPQRGGSLNSVNQQSSWSAGKGLGGTGNLNLMLHIRGSQRDFDNWANITQDPSWSYESVVPYFKRYEKYADPNGNPKYRGFDGDIGIEVPEYTGMGDDFIKAANEIGLPTIDPNTPHDLGVFKVQHANYKGVRDSPYMSLLRPIRSRKTLTIRKFSLVTKILFRENGNEVYGVEYDRHGKTERAYAKKEVIISAGSITTPKLLMLSGIGPKEHLESWGIPCRFNLPVGRNLQDHLGVYLGPIFINEPKTLLLERDVTPGAFVDWFITGGGVLGTSGVHGSALLSSSYAKARGEGSWADIQLFLFGFSVFNGFSRTVAKSFNILPDELDEYYKDDIGRESVLMVVSGARPIARGEIQLGGPSPYDELNIDPNYLNDPYDLDVSVLVEGVQKTLYIFENTTVGKRLGGRFTDKKLPGCTHLPFRSREYWKCYVRRYSVTIHHPTGTAAMGVKGSPSAVVDPQLRVQGISNLRVVDASIIPVIQTTNTQAGTLMIAEKGASMILDHWKDS